MIVRPGSSAPQGLVRPRRVPGGGLGRESGVALLLAVWLLALLAVIAGELMFSTRVRSAAARNRRDDLRAWSLALAGYRAARAALDEKISGLSLATDGKLLFHYDRGEGVPAEAKDVPLGDGAYSWRILDEEGLVSLNDLQGKRAVLGNLLKECGLQPGADRDTIIDSILDWVDPNREHRLNGAEEDYYRGLDPPYSCKDGRIDVVEELLLVRGVTPELFYGKKERDKTLPGLKDLLSPFATASPPRFATAPQAILDAYGKARPAQWRELSLGVFRIVATGAPGGGAPPRTLQAVVQREDTGDSRTLSLLYWNDITSPDQVGKGDGS